MIPAVRSDKKHVTARFRVLGRPKPWSAAPDSARQAPVDRTLIDIPASIPCPLLDAGHASRTLPSSLSLPPATSITIGWFDTAGESSAPRPFVQRNDSLTPLGVTPPATRPSDSDDLILRLAAALQPPLEAWFDSHGVMDWSSPLLPYQQEGIAALLSRRELLLADDMGLGKTIQAIAALRILFFRRQIESVLVVSPASLVAQWGREFAKWAPEINVGKVAGTASDRGILWKLPAHVKIVSYDTLRGDVLDLTDSPVLRAPWSVVVLDEASRIRNSETGVSIACKRIPRLRRWALTGTPLENRIEDVQSILDFLLRDPGDRSLADPLHRSVREILLSVQLRRKKEDVLPDLPPKQVIEELIELLPQQRAAYDRAEQEGVVRLERAGESITVTHILELISRLKQICNHDPATGESAKLADIEERMAILVAEGHRALVFSQFTDARFGVELVENRLAAFSPLSYTGAMSSDQKNKTVDRFQSDNRHKALVLSLRAGGVGLNLQAASYVFHLDRWWNPAIEEQADSRAHRMGQPYPVTIYRYICAGTIEERIDARLREKRQLFHDVVDDVSLDLTTALSEEELFGLFNLKPSRSKQTASESKPIFSDMTGEEFEQWLAERLSAAGFSVELTPATRDGGIDLIAWRTDPLGIESRLFIQCKNRADAVGVSVIRELRGVVPDRTPGTTQVVACPAGFSSDAIAFAETNGVLLWGEADLLQLSSPAR